MEEKETPHSDYQKGFNEAYILGQHFPDLAGTIAKTVGDSERIQGFRHGYEQVQHERNMDKYPSYLKEGRLDDIDQTSPSKEQDKDIEKE